MFSRKIFIAIFCLNLCFSVFVWGESQSVELGIDWLEGNGFAELRGKRVGLVANPASVDSRGRSTIDVLREGKGFELVALFAPEHGLYGVVKAGDHVANCKDKKTGLPVHSLYGDTRKPTAGMFKGVDVVVYDLQDIGCRSYTFISTLGLLMEAAQENGVEVMVLDRPNPLGGVRVEGPRLNPKFRSFVGMFDVPYVHGLTTGELAKWINLRHLKKPCDLRVIKMQRWQREMTWEDTGLRWVATSPNIPTIESARGYVATGLLGEIGVTNGANEELPFQVITSEGLDGKWFSSQMNALGLKGVKFEPYMFKPKTGKYRQVSTGARLRIDSRAEANLTAIAFYAYPFLKKTFPRRNYFGRSTAVEMFDKLSGSNVLRIALQRGRKPSEIVALWDAGVEKWREERDPFLLYPPMKKFVGREAPTRTRER